MGFDSTGDKRVRVQAVSAGASVQAGAGTQGEEKGKKKRVNRLTLKREAYMLQVRLYDVEQPVMCGRKSENGSV